MKWLPGGPSPDDRRAMRRGYQDADEERIRDRDDPPYDHEPEPPPPPPKSYRDLPIK